MSSLSRNDRDVNRRIAELLASDLPLRDVLARFCRVAGPAVAAQRVVVLLGERASFNAVVAVEGDAVGEPRPGDAGPDSHGAAVIAAGRSVVLDAALGVPLTVGGETIGAVCVERPEPFDEADVDLLETCALTLALRVHAARQERMNRALQGLASRDGLTAVANRRAFDDHLAAQWKRCAQTGASLAVVFIDVDHFKAYNDRYGHVAGDTCLQRVAQALGTCLKRGEDLLARYGGEEFAAVLPTTEIGDAIAIAEKMRHAVEELALEHEGSTLGRVSVSAGVAAAPAQLEDDSVAVVKRADEASYAAKARGRNRVVGPGYESATPAARRRTITRHNVPASLSPFIGREREIAELRAHMETSRLVTVSGPGGIGKTRLAMEIARLELGTYDDGVWLIDLATVEEPGLVANAIVTAMSLGASDLIVPEEIVLGALRIRHALLVLDNCEHVVDECARLTEAILAASPGVRILVTTREPLGIAGERVVRLAPLAVPASEAQLTVQEAVASESVRFFVSRAEELAGFTISDRSAAKVAHICRRLDGIPLAIELAVARLRTMTVEQLAERLDDGLALLTGGSRTALPRQQTLHAMIDWSYRLLSPAEQLLFARLGTFAGSWTLDAATAVCSFGVVAGNHVLDHLAQLVEKSLVLSESHGQFNRYRFLESTREFARERLAATGDVAVAHERYVTYHRDMAASAAIASATLPSASWLPPVLAEWDNLRSVLASCLTDHYDPLTGAVMAADLTGYWNAVGGSRDALRWLEVAKDVPDLAPTLRARIALGIAHFLRSSNHDAERVLMLSRLALHLAGDDDAIRAEALVNLGGGYLLQNDTAQAQPALDEALAIARRCRDRLVEADALNNLGLCADFRGDQITSRMRYLESLEIGRALGHDRKTARALHNLAAVAEDLGELDDAAAYSREAIAILESYGAPPRHLVIYLAEIELLRGEVDTAGRLCRDVLQGLVLEHSMWIVRECLFIFAQVHVHAGHDERAARLIGYMETLDGQLAPFQPAVAELYARFSSGLAEALTPEVYERATTAGRALTLDEAIVEASLPL